MTENQMQLLTAASPLAYEVRADALYYRLTCEPVTRTISVGDRVHVDVDADGQAVRIEVLSPPGFGANAAPVGATVTSIACPECKTMVPVECGDVTGLLLGQFIDQAEQSAVLSCPDVTSSSQHRLVKVCARSASSAVI